MNSEREQAILDHISTHSLHWYEDNIAVDNLKTFLQSNGRIFPNFFANDKWPNHDGTFEYVPNPNISRTPKQVFCVQIKGTKSNYFIAKDGTIHL